LAGKAKDMASGAVLFTAIATALVGFLIFYPHLRQYFTS
ncbi:MAG: diacylglycerol kinase, partial [Bacteroidota bacterium]